jgi:hypothetical protein
MVASGKVITSVVVPCKIINSRAVALESERLLGDNRHYTRPY